MTTAPLNSTGMSDREKRLVGEIMRLSEKYDALAETAGEYHSSIVQLTAERDATFEILTEQQDLAVKAGKEITRLTALVGDLKGALEGVETIWGVRVTPETADGVIASVRQALRSCGEGA